ncbi:uncharacterized protein SPSK_02274 [Sporothrix schenckii 1099-18]|uniref:Uncharacterized protein n=1 Tax=Sporothrix schenckii 1099-18 TaxID=1397361 RepID=A0A0F2MEC2_SPOSC|nr:uncharacterized protein SPSK_02274 [Sporothrix schenckii 1099-18]KJR86501.1 hypothetical protein SPSK_02274 [Sporothrix schenckii 1099-18]
MYSPTDQELDDLFGSGQEITPPHPMTNNAVSSFYPLPMALPMPATPKQVGARTSLETLSSDSTVFVPDFTRDQKKQLWKIIKTTQRPGSQTTDPQHLLQRFLDQQAAAATARTQPYTTPGPGAPLVHQLYNIPILTQCEPKANPPPPGARISHARDKNSENRIGQYDWYDKFPRQPNWAVGDGKDKVRIDYNKEGELKSNVKFDRKILEAYIRGCAEKGIPLRLWIQNKPTMHTDRCPTLTSAMCRASDCPETRNKIARGMYQVCFDEHPTETSNGRFDPFYVAGYMHLFCLEEMIPMAELMTFADVQPDVREFPLEQRNPMSLHRDGTGRTLLGAYNEWKSNHYDRFVLNNISISKATRPSSDRLYNFLTVKKMETQPITRQKMRERRNGFDISKHCGNLRKVAMHKASIKKKRKRALSDSSEDSDDADSDVEVIVTQPSPAPKRPRTEAANSTAATTRTPLPTRRRRPRRVSKAHATQYIGVPAPMTVPAPAPALTHAMYNPYGFGNFAPSATSTQSPSRSVRAATLGLNVRTDLAPPVPVPAHYGPLDMPMANLGLDSNSFWNAYNQFIFNDQQILPQTGLPPLAAPAYGASPSSPYKLRDTQARRESAARLVSARASQVSNSAQNRNVIPDHLIDPQLLLGDALANSPHKSSRPQPSASAEAAPADEPLTPSRRVTRSMSRHNMGGTPVEPTAPHTGLAANEKPKTPVIAESDAADLTTADSGATVGHGLFQEDLFADVNYQEYLDYMSTQPGGEQLPEGFFYNQ